MPKTLPVMDADSVIAGLVDRGAHLLFDWIVEPPGTVTRESYLIFSNPVGMDRDFSDTNMMQRAQFGPPSGFVTRSVHAFYGSMSYADRQTFRERYMLTLWILDKRMWESPLIAIPFQGLLFPWANDDPEFGTPNNWPRQANDLGPFPRYIPPLVQFHMELTGKPVKLDSGLRFLPAMNGHLDRAVQ